MASTASPNVWATRAAERKRDGTVSAPSGLVGTAVAPEDPAAVTEDMVDVVQASVGFIVGPKGSTINLISQLTQTHIGSPRRDEAPVFSIFGPRACTRAAVALIRVKAQESGETSTSRRAAERTETCSVPETLVGFVMGKDRSTVQNIAFQSRATIQCPVRGGPPDFSITGSPLAVEAALACIQAKLIQACNVWKQDEWWQAAQTHRRKQSARGARSTAYTSLPSVVTWWGVRKKPQPK